MDDDLCRTGRCLKDPDLARSGGGRRYSHRSSEFGLGVFLLRAYCGQGDMLQGVLVRQDLFIDNIEIKVFRRSANVSSGRI